MSSPKNDSKGWQSRKSLPECMAYMFDNRLSSDITFLVGDQQKEVKAHKFILCRSPVLFDMLQNKDQVDGDQIIINDIEDDIMNALLRYLYTDEVDVDADNVTSLLVAANKYGVDGLSDHCTSYLEAGMTTDNVCLLLEKAHVYEQKELFKKCMKMILEHPEKSLNSPSFVQICRDCLERIVDSDKLALKEEIVFESVMRWADAECKRRDLEATDENRRDVLGHVLYAIRFPLLEKEYFDEQVLTKDLLVESEIASVVKKQYKVVDLEKCMFKPYKRLINTTKVIRFQNDPKCKWPYNGQPDAISFAVSDEMFLHGVIIYGSFETECVYKVKMDVYHAGYLLHNQHIEVETKSDQTTYNMEILPPLKLEAGVRYVAVMHVEGDPSYWGDQGISEIIVGETKVQFHSTTKSKNGTDKNKGQFPGLLLSHA